MRLPAKTLNVPGMNSPGVTRMGEPFRGVGEGGRATRDGPMRSTPVPFTLVATVAQNIAAANPHRKGLILQNKDAAADLYFSFGGVADVWSGIIVPRGAILLDYVCPTDAVWVYSAANVSGYYVEFAPIG